MTGYFYTIDLGDKYGRKFEALPEATTHDDREEFAAIMLARAIDHLERVLKEQLDAAPDEEDCRSPNEYDSGDPIGPRGSLSLDDDIPF